MTEYRLVIDQSTSGTKVILFDTQNKVNLISRKDLKHTQFYPREGWVEHDPKEIIENTETLLKDIIEENDLSNKDILSISITNQRESVLLWDKRTGKPYTNVFVWQCNRGVEICDELTQAGYGPVVKEKTGLRIDPYFSASKLKWYFDNHNLTDEQLEHLAIGTIDSWLLWNLTDEQVFLTDLSNASRTLLFNIFNKEWDEELGNIFNVPVNAFPQVVDSVSNFGNYNSIPIVSVLADSQASLYGHGCHDYGEVKATLGTGSSIMMNIGSSTFNSDESILTTIAWELEDEPVFALEGIIKSYSDNLNWLEQEIELFSDIVEASNEAFRLETNGSVYYIPALEGLGAPFWAPQAQAMFKGMTRDTNKSHLLRAVFEAMAFQTRAVLEELESVSNVSIKSIYVDGGPINNKDFMQLIADVTQKEIVIGQFEETSAFGTLNIFLKRSISKDAQLKYTPQQVLDEIYEQWFDHIQIYLEELK
ncbi:glycerol kinase [Aerococcaceae bacterium DSM 111022]|nr:glycerol kinase [Aerococcaceae bacterium DSM 111022]